MEAFTHFQTSVFIFEVQSNIFDLPIAKHLTYIFTSIKMQDRVRLV